MQGLIKLTSYARSSREVLIHIASASGKRAFGYEVPVPVPQEKVSVENRAAAINCSSQVSV